MIDKSNSFPVKIPQTEQERILIIGGGFGGLQLVRNLKNAPYQVVMVDRHNYHTFQPLLYQVATGGLEPDSIGTPLRKIFTGQGNFIFRMAEAKLVDPEEKRLYTNIGHIDYDYLVFASGSKTNYFGMVDVQTYAMPMKTIPQAIDLRAMLLENLEKAMYTVTEHEVETLIDIVVVGGGPTGVETAGALAELKMRVLPADYPELDFNRMDIYLVELGPKLLAGMSEKASRKTKQFLEKLGVNIWLNTGLVSFDGKVAKFNNGKEIPTTTLIFSAGVAANTIPGLDHESLHRSGRILVNENLKVKGYDNIYAVGDVAGFSADEGKTFLPMVAPVAIQQGQYLAKLFRKKAKNGFKYKDRGAMATIGKNKAVADLGPFKLTGVAAWFVWMFVHLMSIVGFRNRLLVFINWLWYYIFYRQNIRLIIRPFKREIPEPKEETVKV